jgi:hypothetical protein
MLSNKGVSFLNADSIIHMHNLRKTSWKYGRKPPLIPHSFPLYSYPYICKCSLTLFSNNSYHLTAVSTLSPILPSPTLFLAFILISFCIILSIEFSCHLHILYLLVFHGLYFLSTLTETCDSSKHWGVHPLTAFSVHELL